MPVLVHRRHCARVVMVRGMAGDNMGMRIPPQQ